MKLVITKTPRQTKKLGKLFAKTILELAAGSNAKVLSLEGGLGAGKTTFLQGFAAGLGIKEKILSPTFVILRKLQIPKFKTFCHIDCYRVEKPKELIDLGFEKIVSEPQNIVAIEWSEIIKKILPKNRILIKFIILGKRERRITIDMIQYNKNGKRKVFNY